jgi:hypothetical protein
MPSRWSRLTWPALAGLAGVAAAVPLWCSHFLPFQDAPQHLAAVGMLAGRGSAALATRRWFEVDFAHAQYTGFYLPASWLARIVGPDHAIRVMLTLVALLLPLAAWILLRAFRRDPRLAVFAPAVFHTVPLYIGVYNFVAAMPVGLLCIALIEQELRSPALLRAFAIALLAVGLLYLHLSGLAIVLGAALVLTLTAEGPLRTRLARGLAPVLPAVVLLLWSGRATSAYPVDVAVGALRQGPVWQSPLSQVRDLFRFANVLPGRFDEAVADLLALIWIALWVGREPHARSERAWRLPLLAAGLLAGYLVAPVQIGYIAYIHLRALPFLVLLAGCCIAVARTHRTSWLLGAAAAVQIVYAAKLVAVYRSFDAEANAPQLEQVLSAAEPGRRVLSLMFSRKSEVVHFEPYLHFGLYYEVLRGGRVRFNFGELPWMPVRFRHDMPVQRLPAHWEFEPGFFDWWQARADADYVLVRLPDPRGDPVDSPEPGPDFADGWELKARAGRWEVFAPGAGSPVVDAR